MASSVRLRLLAKNVHHLFARELSTSTSLLVRSASEVHAEPPARSPDVPLRIYVNPFCPFAQRVRLAVAAKGLSHESVFIHLHRKPDWFLRLNPMGQVPVIDHNGLIVRESTICFDYLDEVFEGSRQLWPVDAFARAQQKMLLNNITTKFVGNWYKYKDGDMSSSTVLAVADGLKLLELAVEGNGGSFLAGKDYGAVDLLLWPFFERFRPSAVMLPAVDQDFPVEEFPVLDAWMKEMVWMDAIQGTTLPHDIHVQLNRDLVEGKELDYSLADIREEGIIVYASPRHG